MESTTNTPTNTNHSDAAPMLGSASVELVAIVRDDDGGFVAVMRPRHGGDEIRCPIKPGDLATFTRFRTRVADKLGLWVDHNSQNHPRAHHRSRGWHEDVAYAFDAGAEGAA